MWTSIRMKQPLSIVVLLLSAFLSATLLLAQRPSFISRRDFTAGTPNKSISVAVANLNDLDDGILDLVTMNCDDSSISIFLGDGRGGFRHHNTIPIGGCAFYTEIKDYNLDGHFDLAIATYSPASITVLLGDGHGFFSCSGSCVIPVANFNTGIVSDDYNADGCLDLAVADFGPLEMSQSDNRVSVLFGDCTGNFTGERTFVVGRAPEGVNTEDFNNDGKLDLVSLNFWGASVTLLLGDDLGNFTPISTTPLPPDATPAYGDVGDFNGDGNADLATANWQSQNISVLLGNGAGNFGVSNYSTGPNSWPRIVIAKDFDGDGFLDLATSNYGLAQPELSNVSVFLGDGLGGFGDRRDFPVARGPWFVAAGDFNGDNKLDLVTANESPNNISVITGDGAGNFGAFLSLDTPPAHVAVGDVNGDRNMDLIIANVETNTVRVLLGDGLGGFGTTGTFAVQTRPVAVALADFNNDQKLDIVAANFGSDSISVLLGNGNGTFQPAINTPVGARLPNSLTVADFDCDGKQDVAIANPGSNNLRILYGNGNGTFTRSRTLSSAGMVEPLSIVKADFNGTGKWDLAVSNRSSNNVSIFLADGCGPSSGFTACPNLALGAGANPNAISAGDFNNDRKADLVVANNGLNTTSVFLGNGNCSFNPPNNLPVGVSPSALAIADYNGDGKADLAVVNTASNNVSVFFGNGNGFFIPATGSPFFAGILPTAIASGKFKNATGGARPDLVTIDWSSRAVSILFNDIP